ncbi:ferredoxin reductase-like C-terminal NADP-linked domain-containing protein [Phanerochaete sordida]|uniref:Ferredoxin reductase-like C-terminal NADP-linked domain-containing protein n=1 Tax=Phanerochaete sordida TaxID=48140 RepID=A0A9P3L739_9APHY|nr:ferredoxin reductase-like C-terminal NADP-linked domain-containing protein [Phanerochaete sordida]
MFRSRLPLRADQLCRLTACHGPARSTATRKYAAQTQNTSSSRAQRVAVWTGSLGGAALVAAYFFWPDTSRSAPTYTDATLSPAYFTPVTVTATERCKDPNTCLMELTVPREALPPSRDRLFAPIWSVYIKDDDIQVERAYTPLEGIDEDGRMRFWVKKYPKGEVGRWLHSKRAGDKIEIRGPLKTYHWQEDKWDEVVMISGGTGITPFYQLIHSTLLSTGTATPSPRFTLLHSARTPAELPPPELLQPLQSYSVANPDRLRVRLFVDQLDGSSSETVPTGDLQVGRIGQAALSQALSSSQQLSWWQRWFQRSNPVLNTDRKILFLVCGPEPMINAIAGPYGRNYSQGTVGGALAEIGCRAEQVWKL